MPVLEAGETRTVGVAYADAPDGPDAHFRHSVITATITTTLYLIVKRLDRCRVYASRYWTALGKSLYTSLGFGLAWNGHNSCLSSKANCK